MKTTTFDVKTSSRDEFVDITPQVQRAVSAAGVRAGTATVYVPHTTAGVTINENADPDVIHDVLGALDRAIPWQQDFYRHSAEVKTLFLMYGKGEHPVVRRADPADDCEMLITVDEQLSGELIELPADLIILMVGMEPRPDAEALACAPMRGP
jgi:heterodisulfide reductase subunit A-like polyferredoxin